MTIIGLSALGYIKNDYIQRGDPNRLINGVDYMGNICGIDDEVLGIYLCIYVSNYIFINLYINI
jgi:hypothetical protein